MNLSLCASVRPHLKAFADGELSPLFRWRLARHLKACPACQKELIQMKTLSEELKPVETEPALEPELRAKILASAPTSKPVPDAEFLRRRRRVARKKTALALGAASLVGAMLWSATQIGGGFGDSPSMSDATATTSTSNSSNADEVAPGVSAGAKSVRVAPAPSAAGGAGAAPSAGAAQNERERSALGKMKNSRAPSDDSRAPSPVRRGAVDKSASAPPSIPGYYGSGADSVVPAERAVHRQGSMSVTVDNAEQSAEYAQGIIKNAGGYVAQNSLETGPNQKRIASIDCRVPVDKFEVVVQKIGQLGTVSAKSLNGQDITAQVAQTSARREALSHELSIAQARLAEKEKTAKKREAGQIWELRSDVRAVRVQAAQARAALETLQKYGNTSMLWVSLQDRSPIKPVASSWSDSLGVGKSATAQLFLNNARVPFQLLLLVLAYSPIWLPALLLWRKFGRKWLAE